MHRGNEDRCSITSSDVTTCSNTARLLESRRSPGGHRRLEINLSHGAAWKALISRYITVMPLIGDEPCMAMQSMSG
jgi:hypothetical protein